MNINLREEETNEYISLYGDYLREIQSLNKKVIYTFNEVMNESRYEKLQNVILYQIENYNETIINNIENGVFSTWRESEGSLRACLRHYKAGNSADGICIQIEQIMDDLMIEILKIEKTQKIITDRPKVGDSGLEKLEDICRIAQTEIADLRLKYLAQVEIKLEENDLYGTLKPIVNGVCMNITNFYKTSLTQFIRMHGDIETFSARLRDSDPTILLNSEVIENIDIEVENLVLGHKQYNIKNKKDEISVTKNKKEQTLKESLKAFEQPSWDKLGLQMQKEAIEQLSYSVARNLEIENMPDVRYYNSEDASDFGGFSKSENALYINKFNLCNASEIVDTIAHELRHCWQHEFADNSDSPEAQELKENFEHYRKPGRNYEAYQNQPIEKDAREYATRFRGGVADLSDIPKKKFITEIQSKGKEYADLNPKKGAVFDGKLVPSDLESKIDIHRNALLIASSGSPADAYRKTMGEKVYADRRFSPLGMIREGLELFHNLPNGQRTDITPVNNHKAIRTDAKSLEDGKEKGYIPIAWHNHHGLDETKAISGMYNTDGSSNIPDKVYRRGSGYGNNLTCRNIDGTIPDTNQIAVPYEDNPEAMHEYFVDSDSHKKAIDCIAGVDVTNPSDLDIRVSTINDLINNMNAKHGTAERYVDNDFLIMQKGEYDRFQNAKDSQLCRNGKWKTDTTYGVSGKVAPMYVDDNPSKEKLYDGGATQFNTPISINVLVRIGAMWEVK